MSVLNQGTSLLEMNNHTIRYDNNTLRIPESIQLKTPIRLQLNKMGGHHSLDKVIFRGSKHQVSYQLNLGSGTYKKTIR